MYVEVKIIHNMSMVFMLNGKKILLPGIDHSGHPVVGFKLSIEPAHYSPVS